MGLILHPSEIKNQATRVRKYLDNVVSRYSQAEQAVQQYKENEKLNSMVWKVSKETMYVCYQLIMQGIMNVQGNISLILWRGL